MGFLSGYITDSFVITGLISFFKMKLFVSKVLKNNLLSDKSIKYKILEKLLVNSHIKGYLDSKN